MGPVQGLQGKEDLCSASSWPPSFLSRAGAPIFTLHWVLRPLLILGAPTSPVTSEFPAVPRMRPRARLLLVQLNPGKGE